MTERFVELSHVIEDGLDTYPGLPRPRITSFLSRDEAESHYASGTRFLITAVEMVANTGTYIDAPFHRHEDGDDLADMPLASMANLPGITLPAIEWPIVPALFREADERVGLSGRAVLVSTGWSERFGTASYLDRYPFLSRESGEFLAEAGVRLVGIDSPNVDDNNDGTRPVHTELLGAGIPIVEHLTRLDRLPESGFRFFAVPPPIRGFTSFPVRAFAILDGVS